MHPTVKVLRKAIQHIERAWVRRYPDGSITVGISGHRNERMITDLRTSVEKAGFKVLKIGTDSGLSGWGCMDLEQGTNDDQDDAVS